jgi:hypothetical protein
MSVGVIFIMPPVALAHAKYDTHSTIHDKRSLKGRGEIRIRELPLPANALGV